MPDVMLPPAGANTLRGLTMLPLRSIRPSPRNPRRHFDPEALQGLADSIREFGIQQNLVVRLDPQPDEPDHAIVAGERRFRAAWLLADVGLLDPDAPLIPAKVIEVDDARHTMLAILENLQRVDVNALEEAQGFADLIALDPGQWRPSTIAKQLGCSARHIQLRLSLLEKLCDPAQKLLGLGTLTISQAYVLATASHARQKEILRSIERYATLPQLRDAVTDGLVPVTRAKFELEGFDGRLVTLDNGSRYFADRDEFLAAQRAHGQDLAMRLTEAWAWAEFLEDTWFPASRFLPERSDDAGAGVIVLMHPGTGVITIHDQLMPRPAPAPLGSSGTENRHKAPAPPPPVFRTIEERAQRRVQEEEAASELRSALAQRIARDSRTALAVLLADALRAEGEGLLDGAPSDDFGLPAGLFLKPHGALVHLAGLVTDIGRGRVALADRGFAEDAWHALMGLPMLLLLEAVAAWTADHLHIPDHAELPVALRELAEVHAVPVPPHLRDDPDDDDPKDPPLDLVDRARAGTYPAAWDPMPPAAPAEEPPPAPAEDTPIEIWCGTEKPIDGDLLRRFALVVTPQLRGKPNASVTLPDSSVGLQLVQRKGFGAAGHIYEVSAYLDAGGCCWSYGCMSKTRVTAFLRTFLRGAEAGAGG